MLTENTSIHPHMHTKIHFHQSLEHIGNGYRAHHKSNLTEEEQRSHNKPASHEHRYGQNPHI